MRLLKPTLRANEQDGRGRRAAPISGSAAVGAGHKAEGNYASLAVLDRLCFASKACSTVGIAAVRAGQETEVKGRVGTGIGEEKNEYMKRVIGYIKASRLIR